MVVTVVMVTAYCYGRRTHICPRQKGSFLAIFQYGGRERGISPPTGRETGLPPEVTGYHPPTMQAMATGANRKPLQTLFWVRTVAKRGAHASRMDHGEEGPFCLRGGRHATGKTVIGANSATARAWGYFNARWRLIGERGGVLAKGALWCPSRAGKRPTRESQHWRGFGAVSPPETGKSADVLAVRSRGCEPRSHP